MQALIALSVIALLFGLTAAVEFSYDDQESWTGFCISSNTGRQSPINIVRDDVTTNVDLIPIDFGAGWSTLVNGEFINGGHNVQFNPDDAATSPETTTHRGTYELKQFHMHWGNRSGEGSEHQIDSTRYDLEVHFVHTKKSSTNTSAGDYYTVIGVLFSADDDLTISGVWQKLSPATIMYHPSSLAVTDLDYTDLLPSANNRDYYYYMGSLTTPTCDETVQWFVLQEVLSVPSAYLDYLRQIRDTRNETLTENFRAPHSLGSRTVMVQSGGLKFEVSGLVVMLCSALIAASTYF